MRILISILLFICCSKIYTQNTIIYNMKMWTSYQATMWDDSVVNTWGFSEGSKYPPLPGPTLYANEGDSVIINVRNQSQPFHHTIHLHGLDVDQVNDGVPQTSFELPHMADSTYRFLATHAGTYLYHCHVASVVHVQMGMYGNIIVNAANGNKEAYTSGQKFTKEYVWLTSEIDKSWHDNVPIHHDIANDSTYAEFEIPAYEPDYFLVNGKAQQQIPNDSNTAVYTSLYDTLLLRISNVGYYMNQFIFPEEANAQIIMSDGRALPTPYNSDTLTLTPGERYSVLMRFDDSKTDSVDVNYINLNQPNSIVATEYIPIMAGVPIPGIKETERINITASPNPSSIFYINGTIAPTQMFVTDIHGKVVLSTTVTNNSAIDLSNQSNGVYFFSFDFPEYVKTIKVVKQ